MGIAIETILINAVNPGAAGAVGSTVASGDPTIVRAGNTARKVYLENIVRQGTAQGFVQVTSPMLHDPVQGIRITPNESPSVYSLPAEIDQVLQPQDQLTVTISGGAAETDLAALVVYYEDLPGIDARFFRWADIAGNIKNVKPLRVAVVSSATIGQWVDTAITSTENMLHANTDYAIVGYMTNAALACIGVRGSETGNLRVCGPGATSEFATTDYFMLMDQRNNRPWIPVFNSANAASVFVSVAASTASVAAVVELMLVELVTRVTT